MWNWQQSDWPDWKYDPSPLQELEARFLLGAGRLQGVWKHVAVGDREQVKIDLLSEEALKTSAIEGEFLDRSSVQSSIMRQFGLASDRLVFGQRLVELPVNRPQRRTKSSKSYVRLVALSLHSRDL